MSEHDAARAAVLSAALAPEGVLDLRRLRQFLPAEWAGRAAVGLDGVVRVTHPDADADAFSDLPGPVRAQLAALVPAFAGQQLGGEQAVDVLESVHRLSAQLEETRVHATRELAARTADRSLQLKGVTSPDELSRTALERWRVRAKSVTATEIQALTGMGRDTAREVVAIANAPDISRVPVQQGLAAGIVRWDLVLAWWRRCRRMPHESSAVVSRALFGTDVPLEEVARERLTPEGELSTRPWAKKEFFDALEREARVLEGIDPAAQEKKRVAQHESRDAYAIVDDDGTAQLVITGDIASVTAGLERLQTAATKAKGEGDARKLSQLRSDLGRALVLHGTLPLPDLGSDLDLITPDDIQRLADVLSGTPAHEVQVIVPWDVLTGHAALVNRYPDGDFASDAATVTDTADGTSTPDGAGRTDGAGAPDGAGTPEGTSTAGPTDIGAGDTGDGLLEGVGRVLGRFSQFLSAAEVRRIAGRPGTTIYRLLTDPADGRCIERSVARYAPDAAMRAQIRAADVTSRAPGSTVPARWSDLDHVEEYLLGGPTSETNIQALDRPWHAMKTERFWDAVMDASRNVTWGSFWGRLYRTRPHDYNQYLSRRRSEPPVPPPHPAGVSGVEAGPPGSTPVDGTDPDGLTMDEQRHLASLLVYAALAHRAPGGRLEAHDDDPESDAEILGLREAVWLRQTTSSGRRKTGPRPGTPTPEQLIAHDPQVVLDHPDWRDLGGSGGPDGAQGGTADSTEDSTEDGTPGPEPAPPPPF